MRIGITGGIGSGKSHVARMLHEQAGIPVYDSDRRARRLMTTDATLRKALTRLIGQHAYTPDGQLDRAAVAAYLFGGTDHAQAVNAIVHPAVRSDFRRWAEEQEQQGHAIVAIETALLMESHLDEDVDHIVLVDAPPELRLQRAAQRDAATMEATARRQQRQTPHTVLRQHAHYVIHNDGQPLAPQIATLLQEIGMSADMHPHIPQQLNHNPTCSTPS